MGKLRIEPKVKPLLDAGEYAIYKKILDEARAAAENHHVFWDLESGEKVGSVRKAFLFVAEKEGIPLTVRAKRSSHSLSLVFEKSSKGPSKRLSAAEANARILDALAAAGGSLRKSDIISATGVSTASWNVRIKELLRSKKVVRSGAGRETKYNLPK